MRRYFPAWPPGLRWLLISLAGHVAIILGILPNKRPINLPAGGMSGIMQAVLIQTPEISSQNSKVDPLQSAKAGPVQRHEPNKIQEIKAEPSGNPETKQQPSKVSAEKLERAAAKMADQRPVAGKQLQATPGVATKPTAQTQSELPARKQRSKLPRRLDQKPDIGNQRPAIGGQKAGNLVQVKSSQPPGATSVESAATAQKENFDLDQFFNQLAVGGAATPTTSALPSAAVNSQLSSHYGVQIKRAIQANLIRQPDFQGKRCEIALQLAPDGTIVQAQARRGDEQLCEAALRAIGITGRVPKPADLAIYEQYKHIIISFEL